MAQPESFHRQSQITMKIVLFVANTLAENNITQAACTVQMNTYGQEIARIRGI